MRGRVLIVDDESSIRRVLRAQLARAGHEAVAVDSGERAVDALAREPFDLVITDLRMPGMDGIELLEWCRTRHPGLPVVILTAHGTVDSAVEAIKLGAWDYVTKPFDEAELRAIVGRALAQGAARRRDLADRETGRFAIVGTTPAMRELYRLIEKVADTPTTVLVTGESGTGKELVARAIHEQSSRRSGPFIQVNCGAIPRELAESELFGHERGAFTGAHASRPGRFELADGGTLFLDEVGELPKDVQVKLLHVLQGNPFQRVGGVRDIHVDVRIVAATNRDLAEEVSAGRFRKDLYYRLHVIPIHLPPLRERVPDIPLLVEHFVERFNRRLGRRIRGVSPEAMAILRAYRWPGNIRELENVIERAVLLAEGDVIEPEDLRGLDEPLPPDDPDELGLKEYVRVYTARLERARIQRVLEEEGGNVTRASRRLGISRKSLQVKMRDYGLRRDDGS